MDEKKIMELAQALQQKRREITAIEEALKAACGSGVQTILNYGKEMRHKDATATKLTSPPDNPSVRIDQIPWAEKIAAAIRNKPGRDANDIAHAVKCSRSLASDYLREMVALGEVQRHHGFGCYVYSPSQPTSNHPQLSRSGRKTLNLIISKGGSVSKRTFSSHRYVAGIFLLKAKMIAQDGEYYVITNLGRAKLAEVSQCKGANDDRAPSLQPPLTAVRESFAATINTGYKNLDTILETIRKHPGICGVDIAPQINCSVSMVNSYLREARVTGIVTTTGTGNRSARYYFGAVMPKRPNALTKHGIAVLSELMEAHPNFLTKTQINQIFFNDHTYSLSAKFLHIFGLVEELNNTFKITDAGFEELCKHTSKANAQ